MAKISKNAKKLLALTLAGVMTVGTAVPGTAMSTVQEVKAADYNEIDNTSTVQDVLENVLKAFESWSPTQTVFVTGNTYNPTDTGTDASAEISTFIKNVLKWDNTSDNVYSKNGFTLTVTPAAYADSASKVVSEVKFTVAQGGSSKESNSIPLTGIEYYDSTKVSTTLLETVDLSDVEVTSADTTLTVKSKVEDYIKELLKDKLPVETVDEDIKVTATVNKKVSADKATVTYTVTAKVSCGSDGAVDISIKSGTNTFEVSNAASDEAKAAMDYLKTELTEVKVGTTADLNPSANPAKANTAIQAKAKELLNATEYADYAKNVTVSGTILTKGVWTGTITLTGTNDTISDTFEINLTTDAAEDTSIVKIELVEPKDEVEITQNLNDVVKLRLESQDGTVKVTDINTAVQDGTIVYDKTTLNSDGTFKNLGTYSVTFHTTNTATTPTATFTTTVVRTTAEKSITEKLSLGVSTYSAVTTSDSSVLVPTFDSDGNFSGLKALKAGTVTITAIDKSGATFETEVTVKADGTLKYGDAELQATDRVVVNTAANLGFVATDVKSTSQKPVVLDSDTVAKAEIDTLNGVSVIRITPVARGTAEFKVTGGVDKDLETTIKVEVKKDGEVIVTPTKVKVTEVTATNSTASKLSKLVINTDKLKEATETVYDIDNLGLTSSDNLVITVNDKTHRVPALDADKVTVTKNGNTVELKLYYGIANSSKSNIYTVTLGVENTMISNDIETLGIVATQVDSVKNSVAEAVENNWVDVEITEDSEGNPVVLISKGKDAPNNGEATITVSDDNGLTAKIIATFKSGVLTAKVDEKCTQKLEMAVAPNKREYTLGEDVNAAGGFFTYIDSQKKGHKVSLTSEMLNIDTTESTYEYNSKKDEYTNEPVDITVSYGKTSEMPAQKSTEDDAQATYTVKPATSTVSTNTLGLASDEKILSVALKGDASNASNSKLVVLNDAEGRSLSIAALKTEVSGAAVLTTNKGNSISVSISVDENGAITSEVVKAFKSSIKTIKNDNDTLGMTATEATSDNTSVALVNMAGDRITITSVAPGTATITVTDGSNYALIPVSVDEFGNITIGDIQKVGDNGFVRGETITEGEYAGLDNWYYYIDGKMVTNNWVEVNENGTNVWYHFDKDGKMSRGWIIDESGWKIYNLDSNGRMRKDMWINAAANDALGMPAGLYHLQSDGAVQMNGWAESVTAGIYWYCNAGTGLFEQGNPASWSNAKLW